MARTLSCLACLAGLFFAAQAKQPRLTVEAPSVFDTVRALAAQAAQAAKQTQQKAQGERRLNATDANSSANSTNASADLAAAQDSLACLASCEMPNDMEDNMTAMCGFFDCMDLTSVCSDLLASMAQNMPVQTDCLCECATGLDLDSPSMSDMCGLLECTATADVCEGVDVGINEAEAAELACPCSIADEMGAAIAANEAGGACAGVAEDASACDAPSACMAVNAAVYIAASPLAVCSSMVAEMSGNLTAEEQGCIAAYVDTLGGSTSGSSLFSSSSSSSSNSSNSTNTTDTAQGSEPADPVSHAAKHLPVIAGLLALLTWVGA